jgi:hypothetical protein
MAGDDLTLAPSRAHRRRLEPLWQRRGNGPTSYRVHRRRGRLQRPRRGRISVRAGERLEIGPSAARASCAASRAVSRRELGDKAADDLGDGAAQLVPNNLLEVPRHGGHQRSVPPPRRTR